MSAYRSSLFRSLKKEVSEKLPQGRTGKVLCRSTVRAAQFVPVCGKSYSSRFERPRLVLWVNRSGGANYRSRSSW